jgi:serine/threonine protein kinase
MEVNQYLPAGFVIANRYKVIRPLGTGGMASVYLAEDVVLGETNVAVKVLRQTGQFKDDLVHRFLREVKRDWPALHAELGRPGPLYVLTLGWLVALRCRPLFGSTPPGLCIEPVPEHRAWPAHLTRSVALRRCVSPQR